LIADIVVMDGEIDVALDGSGDVGRSPGSVGWRSQKGGDRS
jgi:hypothetical protein